MAEDFLFELGCEELPSAAVKSLSEAMGEAMAKSLEKAELGFSNLKVYATPRRLAVWVKDVDQTQPARQIQRRGPALAQAFDAQGEPTRALHGFAKSCGAEIADLTQMETDKGTWMVYTQNKEGRASTELLPELMQDIIKKLPLAKPMRWGNREDEFARPVHWLLALYGEKCLDLELFGIKSDAFTRGHRFHANHCIPLQHASAYAAILKKAYVLADFKQRRQQIEEQVEKLAKTQNAEAIMPASLLDEVTSIVEWPVAILAHFDEKFLQVPPEALIAAMQEHQKCFALQNADGKLLPAFISVSNIESIKPDQVRLGNEKVMGARLSDAAFFYAQDKKTPLSGHVDQTRRVVFQEKLGSLYDKAERIKRLIRPLAQLLQIDPGEAERAAALSKCDLMTGMVGEFPELQGLMGYYYALAHGETDSVARALNGQYMPRFAKDALPDTPMGKALSLADRLDTLAGIFAIAKKPSGVKDPFKLRRHALAVVRLLASIPISISLQEWLDKTMAIYGNQLDTSKSQFSELHGFIMDRLVSYYQGQGIGIDAVQAVLAIENDHIADIEKRLYALTRFIKRPEAAVLAAACKRVDNILRQETPDSDNVDEKLLQEPAEQQVWQHIKALAAPSDNEQAPDYDTLLQQLAELKAPVDQFFDTVMVMAEDTSLRKNRLRLLLNLQKHLQAVADISLLQ